MVIDTVEKYDEINQYSYYETIKTAGEIANYYKAGKTIVIRLTAGSSGINDVYFKVAGLEDNPELGPIFMFINTQWSLKIRDDLYGTNGRASQIENIKIDDDKIRFIITSAEDIK